MEMNFLKKKKFKFQVDILLADLNDVPFVNAVLFAKVRLLDGGSFCEQTDRIPVSNHHVCWDKAFRFTCRIGSTQNRVLDKCLCKISVRKEEKGGKSHQKLGYVNVNLSEFAGSGVDGQSKTYLLDGYNTGHQRSDNSRLRINVSMALLSGDPIFIVPNVQHSISLQGQLNPVGSKGPARSPPRTASVPTAPGDDGLSVHSGSSGFESLTQKSKIPSAVDDSSPEFMPQHSRGPSTASQGSGYASAPPSANGLHAPSQEPGHSRNNSAEGGNSGVRPKSTSGFVPGHVRRFSNEQFIPPVSAGGRIDSSRPPPDHVIDSLLQDHLGEMDCSEEASGLTLFILEDGSTALGSQGPGTGRYGHQVEVVIPDERR